MTGSFFSPLRSNPFWLALKLLDPPVFSVQQLHFPPSIFPELNGIYVLCFEQSVAGSKILLFRSFFLANQHLHFCLVIFFKFAIQFHFREQQTVALWISIIGQKEFVSLLSWFYFLFGIPSFFAHGWRGGVNYPVSEGLEKVFVELFAVQ